MLAVPILSLVMSPVQAAGILLPIYVISDVFGLIAYRRHYDRRVVVRLLPGAILGVGLGWATASMVDDAVIGGLVERHHPGKRKTGKQVSFSTDLIYDVLRKHEPDHVLLRATRAEAAGEDDALHSEDAPGAAEAAADPGLQAAEDGDLAPGQQES